MQFTTTILLNIALLAAAIASVEGRRGYVSRIPNGGNVNGVRAIGHNNPRGGGARNAFGNDFDDAGREWTVAFCKKDSDNDGLSNGQELGDPCCRWTKSNPTPLITQGLSHPGLASSVSTNPALTNPKC